MAITKDTGRQYPLVAQVDFLLGDLTSGTGVGAIDLPQGATVIGGELVIGTVFNSTSSDVIVIGDSGVADRYLTNGNGQSLGRTALVPTGYTYTAPTTIHVKWTSGGGTPTTGAGTLRVMYALDGRAHEVQPAA